MAFIIFDCYEFSVSLTLLNENQTTSRFQDRTVSLVETSKVQSRGLPVAELRVSGVKMDFVKRPLDSTVGVSIHELLLADAMQTYGPDYELLLASHKHVT